MTNLIDIAGQILSQSERRVEVAGQNIANVATPGYKRRAGFALLLAAGAPPDAGAASVGVTPDLSPGKLMPTGRAFDLAIAGRGFFAVSAQGRTLYTRQGQFQRDAEGRLTTAQGFAVQAEDGGDIRLKGDDFKVSDDGSVLEAGEPVGKIALFDIPNPQAAAVADAGFFSVADADVTPSEGVGLRQGMLEASNVSMGDEMVTLMEALRRAESGQRLAGVYDDLMGRLLTSVGQS